MRNYDFNMSVSSEKDGSITNFSVVRSELAALLPAEPMECVDIALSALHLNHLLKRAGFDDVETEIVAPRFVEQMTVGRAEPGPEPAPTCATEPSSSSLIEELEAVINRNSAENGSDTPDFILASLLSKTLDVFNDVVTARERWYGRAAGAAIESLVGATEVEVKRATDTVELRELDAAERKVADLRRTIDVQEKRLADLTQELSVYAEAHKKQEALIAEQRVRADNWRDAFHAVVARLDKVRASVRAALSAQ